MAASSIRAAVLRDGRQKRVHARLWTRYGLLRTRVERSDMNGWDDPRITRGMQRQLSQRRARIAAGEKPLGWKVGLGARPAMQKRGITMPLVGYMMQKSLVQNGATVS